METAVQFERYVTGTGVFRIIVGKFSHWYEPVPIILLEIDQSSEIGLYRAVLPLGLAISLSVESSGEPLLDPKEVA